jgi:hypothetical protein
MEAQLGNPAVDHASNIAIDSLKACENMFMGRAPPCGHAWKRAGIETLLARRRSSAPL